MNTYFNSLIYNLMKIILSLMILKFIYNSCVMQQDCNVLDPNCHPGHATGNRTIPFILQDDPNNKTVVCEEFLNKQACCTIGQNYLMSKNFKSIDTIFNTIVGGCDICSINIKRFWCYFTCAPNQDEFCNYRLI
jgi:hypothetical protein